MHEVTQTQLDTGSRLVLQRRIGIAQIIFGHEVVAFCKTLNVIFK